MLCLWFPWQHHGSGCGAWAQPDPPPCTSWLPCQAWCWGHSAASGRCRVLTEDVLWCPHSVPQEHLFKNDQDVSSVVFHSVCALFCEFFISFILFFFSTPASQQIIPHLLLQTKQTPPQLWPSALELHYLPQTHTMKLPWRPGGLTDPTLLHTHPSSLPPPPNMPIALPSLLTTKKKKKRRR